MYDRIVKPFFDFCFALIGVLVLGPIILIVAVGLAIANKGNPFFCQRRPGKDERIFTIIKFKTMNDNTDLTGNLLPDSERLTPVGKFVRATSLDEIPQLFNVLMGQMSFVGPRPLLVEYLALYNETQKQRHKVKPGITGWAQINGRNDISWERKLSLDVWYVQNQSFQLDMRILLLTILKVVKKEGINRAGEATMTRFKGN